MKKKEQAIIIDIGERQKAPLKALPVKKKTVSTNNDETGVPIKIKFKSWKQIAGGGFEHQFFDNV